MERLSATQIGRMIYKTGREVNELLKERGYLEGEPGAYRLTDEGREHGEDRDRDNGHGGRAHRAWSYVMWGVEIVGLLSNFPNVDWYCDSCDAFLNIQDGFTDQDGSWVCTKCGYQNTIAESEIREE